MKMPRKSAARVDIERRIIGAVRRAVALGYSPNRIYLDEDDMADLVATYPKMHEPFKVDGMPVRLGVRSRLICKFGALISL